MIDFSAESPLQPTNSGSSNLLLLSIPDRGLRFPSDVLLIQASNSWKT
jgi:hypothetical protein